jgi:hypothetical protein
MLFHINTLGEKLIVLDKVSKINPVTVGGGP